jgi:hypothetical protein
MTLKSNIFARPLPALESFEIESYGTLGIPSGPVRFGFQVDLAPNILLQEVVFGLVEQSGNADDKPIGFAVRLDLQRGEVWDLANDSGLIGWVDQPIGYTIAGGDEPILLSLEIERVGSAFLPKLQIGGEEWLYPAIRSTAAVNLVALGGFKATPSNNLSPKEIFANPSVWCEENKK